MKQVRVLAALALTAAAVRLVTLQWLHALQWDEVEFFRAARWVAAGQVPFRDFWEHHTPLQWFVFAPFSALASAGGAGDVIAMRWAQLPVWVATFWLLNVWMRRAGLEPFARWAALAIALASSLFMLPAVEFRPDALACLLYVAGLVLAQRGTARAAFAAGALFCLSAFANLRMGPLLVLTVLILLIADTSQRRWRLRPTMAWLIAGGFAALAVCTLYFAATGTAGLLVESVVTQNYLADKHSPDAGPMFLHRLLIPFGFRLLGSAPRFDPATVDAGGVAVIVLSLAGFIAAVRRLRAPDEPFVMAFLAAASVLFVATMKYVFVYHLMIAVLLGIPLVALAGSRLPRRAVFAVVAVAWCVNLYASLLRGKELDLAYQDLILRETLARSTPRETVWSGGPWPIHRRSPYRIWFLHEIARVLLRLGRVEPYRVTDPPAVVVFDHNTNLWLTVAQPELAPYFVRHYTPLWRNLWVPGLNAIAGPRPQGWIVPRDGVYRLFASEELVQHPWFRYPLPISAFEQRNARRFEVRLPPPAAHPALHWTLDGQPAAVGPAVALRKGQRLTVTSDTPLAVFLLPGSDTVIFRQPPPGVTLEASSPRETHLPRFGARLQ